MSFIAGMQKLTYGNFHNVCLAPSVEHLARTTSKSVDLPKSCSSSRSLFRNVKTVALLLCLCGILQFRPSEAFARCLLGHRQLRGPAMPRHVLQYSRQDSAECEGGPWRDEEDWALLDETPAFTVGSGTNTVTFWSALATASPVLGRRTALELERRRARLAVDDRGLSAGPFGREPSVLSSWERLPDGRFTGTVDGRKVWLTVEEEGRLASDPREGAGYLVSIGGRVYELGESSGRVEEPRLNTILPGGQDQRAIQSMGASVTRWLPCLGAALLAGGIGLCVGASDVEPHKMMPRVTMASVSANTQPPSAVPLALSEQRARLLIVVDKQKAEIARLDAKLQTDQDPANIKAKVIAEEARLQNQVEKLIKNNHDKIAKMETRLKADVERQKNKLTDLRLKLRQSEQLALELRRVETERGPNVDAVRMSIPKLSERF